MSIDLGGFNGVVREISVTTLDDKPVNENYYLNFLKTRYDPNDRGTFTFPGSNYYKDLCYCSVDPDMSDKAGIVKENICCYVNPFRIAIFHLYKESGSVKDVKIHLSGYWKETDYRTETVKTITV